MAAARVSGDDAEKFWSDALYWNTFYNPSEEEEEEEEEEVFTWWCDLHVHVLGTVQSWETQWKQRMTSYMKALHHEAPSSSA